MSNLCQTNGGGTGLYPAYRQERCIAETRTHQRFRGFGITGADHRIQLITRRSRYRVGRFAPVFPCLLARHWLGWAVSSLTVCSVL